MSRIVFIGAPGCGKSTLATELFVNLKKKNINCELITEWVRTDIHLHGPISTIFEQYRTRMKQMEIEDAVPNNVDYIITDSGTLTPYFYAELYCDHTVERQRLVLQDMYKYFLDDLFLKRYDHIFYLPATHAYNSNKNILNDGTRFQTQNQVDILDMHMSLMFEKLHKLTNVHTLNCDLDERVEKVLKYIQIPLDK